MNSSTETDTSRRAPSLGDRMRTWVYLQRVDWRLSLRGIGWNHRKQIKRELKGNVRDAAAHEDTVKETLDRLGKPAALADEYADPAAQRGFLNHAAGIWALASFAVLQAVGIGINVGFREGADAAGADQRVAYAFEFAEGFGPFSGSYAPEPTMAAIAMITPAHLVIMVVAALIGGRIWRVAGRWVGR